MERKPVRSSNILNVGYDETTQTLQIEYLTHRVYNYFGVPKEVYEAMMKAPSVGKYFWANIRTQYAYGEVKTNKERD